MGLKSVLPMRRMGWSETIKICKLEGADAEAAAPV